MLGFFISLVLVLTATVGTMIPGALDGALSRALQDKVGPAATASVRVDGDPLLEIPFGHLSVIEAHLTGYRVAGVPLKAINVRLTDVKIQPHEALFNRRAVLERPAGAHVAVSVDTPALQGLLDRLVDAGTFNHLPAGVALFGRPLTASVKQPVLALQNGRVEVTGIAELQPTGARVPFSASVGLEIEAGRCVNMVAPEVKLNGRALPAFLLAGALGRYNPVLDLRTQPLPAGDWRLSALALEPDGATLTVTGELTALP